MLFGCITQTLFQQIKSMLMPRGPRNLTGDLFSRQISKQFGYLRKSINIVRKYEKNPRICLTSFLEFGGFMSCTHAILCGSGPWRPEPIVCPTNVTDDWANLHFSNFRVRPCSFAHYTVPTGTVPTSATPGHYTPWVKKTTRHQSLAHKFTKYLLIFTILSLLDSVVNL